MRQLEDFLKPTQEELFRILCKTYRGALVKSGSYILVPGTAPIMLVAHMDTVHREPVRQICKTPNGNILMSPQGIGGDDRCGVFALVTAHERAEVKPWLLFTCDEEVGGIGASEFCTQHGLNVLPKEMDDLKLIVEIDRKGRTDAVYYDCDNPEFEKYISGKGFKTADGSFSDISYIAPELGVAAVNLSSGYYDAHTRYESINRKHLNGTIRKVVEIIADSCKPDFPKYEYIEAVHATSWGRGYGYYGDYDRYGLLSRSSGKKKSAPLILPDAARKGESTLILPGDDDEPDLSGVPEEIRHEFRMLLDFYTEDELHAIRFEHGNWAIRALYESEIGQYYADVPPAETLDTDGADVPFPPKKGGGW